MALKRSTPPPSLSAIIAEKTESGALEIIDGHRRYDAARGLGYKPFIRRELGEGLVEIEMQMPARA